MAAKRKSRSGSYVHEAQRSGIRVAFRLGEPAAAELRRRANAEGVVPNACAARVVREALGKGSPLERAASDLPAALNDHDCNDMGFSSAITKALQELQSLMLQRNRHG